jgi:hypothetical protein
VPGDGDNAQTVSHPETPDSTTAPALESRLSQIRSTRGRAPRCPHRPVRRATCRTATIHPVRKPPTAEPTGHDRHFDASVPSLRAAVERAGSHPQNLKILATRFRPPPEKFPATPRAVVRLYFLKSTYEPTSRSYLSNVLQYPDYARLYGGRRPPCRRMTPPGETHR